MPTFVLFGAGLYVCFAFRGVVAKWAAEARADGLALSLRVRLLGLSPVLAAVSSGILLVAQLRAMGTTQYYFLKYMLGVELILAAVVPAILAVVVG